VQPLERLEQNPERGSFFPVRPVLTFRDFHVNSLSLHGSHNIMSSRRYACCEGNIWPSPMGRRLQKHQALPGVSVNPPGFLNALDTLFSK